MSKSKNLSFMPVCAFCLFVAVALLFWPEVAQGQAADEDLEREAQAIDKMIMCPVCPAETIDQAQVEISFQMRAVIREMLAEGRSRQEILDYFVDRYGADILAAPPKSGANLVAWILPVAGVVAGVAVLFLIVRSMTGQGRTLSAAGVGASRGQASTSASVAVDGPSAEVEEDDDLSPYLQIVDRNLAIRRAGSTAFPEGGTSRPDDAASEPESPTEPGSDG